MRYKRTDSLTLSKAAENNFEHFKNWERQQRDTEGEQRGQTETEKQHEQVRETEKERDRTEREREIAARNRGRLKMKAQMKTSLNRNKIKPGTHWTILWCGQRKPNNITNLKTAEAGTKSFPSGQRQLVFQCSVASPGDCEKCSVDFLASRGAKSFSELQYTLYQLFKQMFWLFQRCKDQKFLDWNRS